ncbi:unnamed protein product [Heligmosomoides polygyrus]|uniref:G_PROTEIN_RECEP_F1_2 domain-containing protein n=1 Tax=Heligmosomoides polygyrus TaxID=6339 RepID=A0A3P7ZBC6_HELPZ|nr:unnamed protein product [Heligmosomoides polygyrus]
MDFTTIIPISEKLTTMRWNMYIYNLEGFIILLVNVPLVLTIILLPRLRERKEFAMIAGLAIGDLIYTVGYMAVSIRRIFEIDYDRNGKIRDDNQGQLRERRGIHGVLHRVWSSCSGERVWSMCVDATYPGLRSAIALNRGGCVILSALIYSIVAVLVYKNFSRSNINRGCTKLSNQQLKNVVNGTVTMGLCVVNAVALLLVPDILITFSTFNTSSTLYLLFYSLILNKIMVNFILFVTRHREFQRVFSDLLHAKWRSIRSTDFRNSRVTSRVNYF